MASSPCSATTSRRPGFVVHISSIGLNDSLDLSCNIRSILSFLISTALHHVFLQHQLRSNRNRNLQSLLSSYKPNVTSPSSRANIISAAEDLSPTHQTPQQHVLQLSSDTVGLIASRTIMQMQVLEGQPTYGSNSLQDLVSKTKAQPVLSSGLLRVLIDNRFLSLDAEGNYEHTHISKGYVGPAGLFFTWNLYQPVLEALSQFPLGYMDAEKQRADGL